MLQVVGDDVTDLSEGESGKARLDLLRRCAALMSGGDHPYQDAGRSNEELPIAFLNERVGIYVSAILSLARLWSVYHIMRSGSPPRPGKWAPGLCQFCQLERYGEWWTCSSAAPGG